MKSNKQLNGGFYGRNLLSTAATLGFIASGSDSLNSVQAKQINNEQLVQLRDPDSKDSIGTSSADDMFAFSQIIASGGNPLQVAAAMEKDNIANKPKPAVNALDDDSSVAMFAQYMATGEGAETIDPAKVAAAKKKAEDDKKANEELKELQSNDATSAFAGLIEAQNIESKAEKYEGSAPEEKDEDEEKPKPKPKAKKAKKKAAPAKKKITPKKKISLKPKVNKSDVATVGTDEQMDASTMKAIENSSNLPSTPEAAQAAEDVPTKPKLVVKPKVKASKPIAHKIKKTEDSEPAKPAHKIAHKKKKDDDLPPEIKIHDDALDAKVLKVEPHIERDDDPPASDANAAIAEQTAPVVEEGPADPKVDAQADEILEQIKAASANIKDANGSGADDQVKGLESLLANAGSLVQISEDIKIDPEAELAFDYLEHQFPEDYPEDKVPEKVMVLTEEQKEAEEKKEIIKYGEDVASQAADYNNQLEQEKQAREDAKKTPAEIAGMIIPEDKTLPYANTKKLVNRDGSLNLAQTSSKQHVRAQSKMEIASEEALEQITTMDLNNMSAEELKQYSDSLSAQGADSGVDKAAELITNESVEPEQKPDENSGLSLLDLRAKAKSLAQVGSKQNVQIEEQETELFDAKKQKELDQKEAIIAQTESANSAVDAQNLPELTTIDAATIKKNMDAQEVEKKSKASFEADKQSALDQGYTEEQALKFANQEALANKQARKQAEKETKSDDTIPPEEGIAAPAKPVAKKTTVIKPKTKVTIKKASPPAEETAAPTPVTNVQEETSEGSIQDQIQQAQKQQKQIKAALDKKKQAAAPAEVAAPVSKTAEPAAEDSQTKEQKAQQMAEAQLASMSPEELKELNAQTQSQDAGKPAENSEAPQSIQAQAQLTAEQMQEIQAQAEAQAQQEADQAEKDKKAAAAPVPAPAAPKPVAAPKKLVIKPKSKVVASVKKIEPKKPAAIKVKPQIKAPVKVAVKPVVKAPIPKPVAKPKAVMKPAPAPVAEPVESAPVEVEAAPAEPVTAPVVAPKTHEKSHSQDVEKIQQQADVNTEPQADIPAEKPEDTKVPEVSVNKKRSIQYEKDLNSARDQIIKAQKEMKSIDSEVQNFHQKMALSMHSLLKAFTEGFEAMDKAKEDEVDELKQKRQKKDEARVQKFDKVHSGISNLEALTSQLKMSFDDQDAAPSDNGFVGTQVQQPPTVVPTQPQPVQAVAKPVAQVKAPVAKPAAAAPQKVAQVAVTKPAPAVKTAVAAKPAIVAKPAAIAKPVAAAKPAPAKIVKPAPAKPVAKPQALASKSPVKKPIVGAKPAVPVKPVAAPASKANLKAKMSALLSKKPSESKKTIKLQQKPLKLAQQESEEELLMLTSENMLASLKQTHNQLKHIGSAMGYSKEHNKAIAQAMAERVLAQLDQGKSQTHIEQDLKKSKEALVLAQKAFYDKDPSVLQYLQINADVNNGEQEKIYIDSKDDGLADDIQLQESETDQIGTSPSQEEDNIQELIDTK